MPATHENFDLPASVVDPLRDNPIHAVLVELSRAAVKLGVVRGEAFRRLLANILELADGRDRRESWVQRPGVIRPVPRLRILVDECFGQYGDFQWFRLNRITNDSGGSLRGMFPRMAPAMGRASDEDLGKIVTALVSDDPDRQLQQLINECEGKLRGVGVELLSRLAYALRPDLYFLIPRGWGEASGCTRFIGTDLRLYCALCRQFRDVCDAFEIERALRGGVLAAALESEPIHRDLVAHLHRALGPAMTRFTVPLPQDAYVSNHGADEHAEMPLDFAARAIIARRGPKRLRDALLTSSDGCCAMSGPCPIELLEVAYVTPFPAGDVHSVMNALLLRADLHTMWDLNMVAIDPSTMRIRVADTLLDSEYGRLDGRKLLPRHDGSRISSEYVRDRWDTIDDDRFQGHRLHGSEVFRPEVPRATARDRAREDAFPGPGGRGDTVRRSNGAPARTD